MSLILLPPYAALAAAAGALTKFWNPADKASGVVLTNDNLTASTPSTAGYQTVRANFGISAGIFYWEVRVSVVASGHYAFHSAISRVTGNIGLIPGYSMPESYAVHNSDSNSMSNVIFGCTLNLNTLQFSVKRNNVAFGATQNISGGGIWYPTCSVYANDAFTANFGEQPFVYPPA